MCYHNEDDQVTILAHDQERFITTFAMISR
jgi:hypothetical protein